MYRFRNSDPGRVSLSVIVATVMMLGSPLAYAAQHSGGGNSHSSQESGNHSGSSGHDSGTDHGFSTDHGRKPTEAGSAVSFLAAAADKFTPLSPDAIAYENAILDINNKTLGSVTYSDMDYSAYSYDRSDTYADVTANVVVKHPDSTYVATDINVYDAVFGGSDYCGTGTFDAFATAVDDARCHQLHP